MNGENPIEELIPLGRIIKPHGLRGEVKAKIALDDGAAFKKFEEVTLFNEETASTVRAKIDGARKVPKGWILHFENFENLAQAERLTGYGVYVREESLPKLKNGEYYFYQVLGCEVYDEQNELIGVVEDIIETGANDVMLVRRRLEDLSIHEELIPLIKACVISMDFEKKRILARPLRFEGVVAENEN